jgi:hypothetical protein
MSQVSEMGTAEASFYAESPYARSTAEPTPWRARAMSPEIQRRLAWLPVRAGSAVVQLPLASRGGFRDPVIPPELLSAAASEVECEVVTRPWTRVCRQALKPASLPAEWSALVGEPLQLYDGLTPTCVGYVQELAIESAIGRENANAAALEGQTGRFASWSDLSGDVLGDASRYLTLRISLADPGDDACWSATWARSPRLARPTTSATILVSPWEDPAYSWSSAALREATRRFRAHPAWRTIQRRARAALRAEGSAIWDDGPSVYFVPWNAGTWVVAQADGGGPCVDWWDQLRIIWWVDAPANAVARTRRWKLIGAHEPLLWEADAPAPVFGAVDTDGDGKVELLTPRERVHGESGLVDDDGLVWEMHSC